MTSGVPGLPVACACASVWRVRVYVRVYGQGGILGGAYMAVTKDITRGVLGETGCNYALLLSRSVDFTEYVVPICVGGGVNGWFLCRLQAPARDIVGWPECPCAPL